jgi:hypothetical protein
MLQPKEYVVSSIPINESGHVTARAALIVAALYLALAVGAPWLLNDAPPSAQDVLATQACCTAAGLTGAAKLNKSMPAR